MNNAMSQTIVALFAFIPYLLVSWWYKALTDGGVKEFWIAFGVLLAVRLFFSAIETLGSILVWRLYGKRIIVKRHLDFMRANNFPMRKYSDDDFLDYLARIEDDPEYPASIKGLGKEMRAVLVTCEGLGILLGMRMHSAADEALDVYSPRANAPLLK